MPLRANPISPISQVKVTARTKSAYCARAGICQRDRCGVITFDHEVVTHIPPSAKHFNVLLHTLDRARAQRPGQLIGPLNKVAEQSKLTTFDSDAPNSKRIAFIGRPNA